MSDAINPSDEECLREAVAVLGRELERASIHPKHSEWSLERQLRLTGAISLVAQSLRRVSLTKGRRR